MQATRFGEMSQVQEAIPEGARTTVNTDQPNGRAGWLAAGGVLGAILASVCCVVPLVLVTLGISGAWIGNLTALEPYKPYSLGATAIMLGAGFWLVYFRPKQVCADGAYCARPSSRRTTKIALWGGALIAVVSATLNLWAPFLY